MAVMMVATQQEYSYETLAEALLDYLSDGNAHPIRTTIEQLADRMQLSKAARTAIMAAGLPRFNYAVYRLHRFLTRIDFIHKVSPGVYRMSLAGQAFVSRSPQLNLELLQQFYKSNTTDTDTQPYAAIPSLRQTIQTHLTEIQPEAFQRLVVALLKAMNYQGSFEGNIDTPDAPDYMLRGIIREDRLGLKDTIYVHAQRSGSGAGVSQVQMDTFVAGMQSQDAAKGIFLTNRSFDSAARHQAERLAPNTQIALIDGEFLIQLLIEYRVGIIEVQQVTQVIDPDFFPEFA